MPKTHLIIDVKHGPALRAIGDVLDFAVELWDLIPEWHSIERDELQQRAQTLCDTMQQHWELKLEGGP
jgi:hypothetical protein